MTPEDLENRFTYHAPVARAQPSELPEVQFTRYPELNGQNLP